jgi:hypothetical protein
MSEARDPHDAVDFILKNAPKYAEAKGQRVQIENFLKSKKALLMNEASHAKTIAEREAFAYAHPDYIELGKGLAAAVEREETLKWQMTAAELRVEVWRSQEASNRRMDRATQ